MSLSQDPPVYRQHLSVGTVSRRIQAGAVRIVEMKSRHLTACSGRPVQAAVHFIFLSKALLFQRLGDQRIRTQLLRRVMVSVKQRHQLLLYRTGKLHILFLKISSDLHLKHLNQKEEGSIMDFDLGWAVKNQKSILERWAALMAGNGGGS